MDVQEEDVVYNYYPADNTICQICGLGTLILIDDEYVCSYCNTTLEEMK